jgi:hypothetical protein
MSLGMTVAFVVFVVAAIVIVLGYFIDRSVER